MKGVERDLITVQEAAEVLGISVQAVHQELRRGLVRHEVVAGRKMVDRHRLLQRWKGINDLKAQAEL
jgi:predicted HTH domain antitoxin